MFYPDEVAVSQHLTDLAIYLSNKGHNISVFTSKYPYDSKKIKYSKLETYNKIKIFRVNQSRFGKSKVIFRLIDFLTFYISIFFKLSKINHKEYDFILGTSVPPMLSFIAVIFSKIKKIKFYYWVMDLQPELSIKSGLIKKNSLISKVLTVLGNYSIKNSDKIFSLDTYMSRYLKLKGANDSQIFTNPLWPSMSKVFIGKKSENPFRIKNKFNDKIVVMYSGNHSFVHPLDTILDTAKILEENNKFIFVFIGEGVRKKDVIDFKHNNKLNNIIHLPFQPRKDIHYSLGSSDLQLVVMGKNQVGYTHPNKIYGGLFIGKPIVYIGPDKSHVTDILNELSGNIIVNHGDSKKLANMLIDFSNLSVSAKNKIGEENRSFANLHYSPEKLKLIISNQILNND